MILELPKENVTFGTMGEVKNGILYIYRLNCFYNLMTEIAYYIYGTDKCWYCGKLCRRGPGEPNDQRAKVTLDHLIPASIGGPTIVNNLRPACHSCNDKLKGDLTSEQFIEILSLQEQLEECSSQEDRIKLNKKIVMRRVQMRNELAKKRRGIIPYLPEEWISKDVTGDLYGTISPDIKLGKQFKRQDEFYQKYKRIRDPLVISNNGFLLSGYNSVSISKKHEIPWQLQKIVLENVFVYLRRGTPY